MLCALLPDNAVCGPTLDSLATNFGMSQLIHKQLAIVGDMRLSPRPTATCWRRTSSS